jgi:hypothetical protein
MAYTTLPFDFIAICLAGISALAVGFSVRAFAGRHLTGSIYAADCSIYFGHHQKEKVGEAMTMSNTALEFVLAHNRDAVQFVCEVVGTVRQFEATSKILYFISKLAGDVGQ